MYRIAALAACTSLALLPAAATGQRQQPTPEQRIDRLEKQVSQVQRQVFPRGRPADTAGFSTEPAATQSSVVTLDQRLDSVERQMTDLLRQSEENGHRLQALEADIGKIRSDQDQRIGALEQRMAEAASAAPVIAAPAEEPPASRPPPSRTPSSRAPARGKPPSSTARPNGAAVSDAPSAAGDASAPESDPGEDAYSEGFHEWQAGQFDQAIATLKRFVAAYPKHRRASFANNLIGRAYLDKGDPQSAAAVLLANYRSNPDGERAQDSLYYLGQAVMKMGQPSQACRAYAELESVYGSKVRADLQKLLSDAKAQAQCS